LRAFASGEPPRHLKQVGHFSCLLARNRVENNGIGSAKLKQNNSSTTTFAGVRLRRTTAPLETSGSFFLPTGKKSGGEIKHNFRYHHLTPPQFSSTIDL